MHKVASIDGTIVTDEEGKYPIKEVLPVPEGTTELQLVGRGLSVASQAKRDALKSERNDMENYLEAAGGQAVVRTLISDLRLEVPGFFEKLAREGLTRQKPIDAFVALLPDVFEVYSSGRGRGVRLRD